MPTTPKPWRVQAPFHRLAWCIVGSALLGITWLFISMAITEVFVPASEAPNSLQSSFDWGNMPNFVIQFVGITGAWTHAGFRKAQAPEKSDAAFYGLTGCESVKIQTEPFKKSNRSNGLQEPAGSPLVFYTDCLAPRFHRDAFDMHQFQQNNDIQLYFAFLPDASILEAGEKLFAVALSVEFANVPVRITTVVQTVPIAPCNERLHSVPTIELRKEAFLASCTDSPWDLSHCRRETYCSLSHGLFAVADIDWKRWDNPTLPDSISDGTTGIPSLPATEYCGSVDIKVIDPKVRLTKIPASYQRFFTCLAKVGGLFTVLGLVFSLCFGPQDEEDLVFKPLRSLNETAENDSWDSWGSQEEHDRQ